jgi:hypothetical protein
MNITIDNTKYEITVERDETRGCWFADAYGYAPDGTAISELGISYTSEAEAVLEALEIIGRTHLGLPSILIF